MDLNLTSLNSIAWNMRGFGTNTTRTITSSSIPKAKVGVSMWFDPYSAYYLEEVSCVAVLYLGYGKHASSLCDEF